MKTIAIDDLVFMPGAYPTHGAHMRVTKINRKSFRAVEEPGSYKPGTVWIVSSSPYCRRLARRTYNDTIPYVTDEWFYLGERGEMIS